MAKTKQKPSAQDIQDAIFKKMSADKKIRLVFELANLCRKLNSLNGNIRSGKTSPRNRQNS